MSRLWTPDGAVRARAAGIVFSPGPATTPDGPYTVADPTALVDKLAQGCWVIYPHEWSIEDGEDQHWRSRLSRLCLTRSWDILIQVQKRMSLTVAFSTALVPPVDQLTLSVSAVTAYREKDLPIPTEHEFLTRRSPG
ncbi:hypothetical protein [Amycolatopsis sp. NPDC098790]|uniref:hypothetical protein n=1 Tax=Amycolatopsis sp. NPDC098790 TaxID=3363939 RepID=UPI0037F9A4C8